MTFTVSGNDLAAQITTDRTDVGVSFDGTDWGQTKSTGVGHNEKVIAQIRYAETDDYNASPPYRRHGTPVTAPLHPPRPGGTHLSGRGQHRVLDLRRLRPVFCILQMEVRA